MTATRVRRALTTALLHTVAAIGLLFALLAVAWILLVTRAAGAVLTIAERQRGVA